MMDFDNRFVKKKERLLLGCGIIASVFLILEAKVIPRVFCVIAGDHLAVLFTALRLTNALSCTVAISITTTLTKALLPLFS